MRHRFCAKDCVCHSCSRCWEVTITGKGNIHINARGNEHCLFSAKQKEGCRESLYWRQYKPGDRGQWSCQDVQTDTPTSKQEGKHGLGGWAAPADSQILHFVCGLGGDTEAFCVPFAPHLQMEAPTLNCLKEPRWVSAACACPAPLLAVKCWASYLNYMPWLLQNAHLITSLREFNE